MRVLPQGTPLVDFSTPNSLAPSLEGASPGAGTQSPMALKSDQLLFCRMCGRSLLGCCYPTWTGPPFRGVSWLLPTPRPPPSPGPGCLCLHSPASALPWVARQPCGSVLPPVRAHVHTPLCLHRPLLCTPPGLAGPLWAPGRAACPGDAPCGPCRADSHWSQELAPTQLGPGPSPLPSSNLLPPTVPACSPRPRVPLAGSFLASSLL